MAGSSNYTKSLKPFAEILESHEAEYRDSSPAMRDGVIAEIATVIQAAAGRKGVKVADSGTLHKVSLNRLYKTTTG